jgi:hypothetical protein
MCRLLGFILTKVANVSTDVGGIKKYITGYQYEKRSCERLFQYDFNKALH